MFLTGGELTDSLSHGPAPTGVPRRWAAGAPDRGDVGDDAFPVTWWRRAHTAPPTVGWCQFLNATPASTASSSSPQPSLLAPPDWSTRTRSRLGTVLGAGPGVARVVSRWAAANSSTTTSSRFSPVQALALWQRPLGRTVSYRRRPGVTDGDGAPAGLALVGSVPMKPRGGLVAASLVLPAGILVVDAGGLSPYGPAKWWLVSTAAALGAPCVSAGEGTVGTTSGVAHLGRIPRADHSQRSVRHRPALRLDRHPGAELRGGHLDPLCVDVPGRQQPRRCG